MKSDKNLLVPPTEEQRIGLCKIRLKKEISDYLSKNPQQSLNGISIIIGVHHSRLYDWYDGKFKEFPNRNNIDKLAHLLKINPLYLLGESNFRIVGNDDVDLKTLVGESALLGLRELKNTLDYYKEIEDYIIFDDLAYTDIVGAIIGNANFWKTLIHEANRLIQLETHEHKQNEFERIMNKEDMIDNPTRIEYKEIIHQVNAKALNKVFDDYINEKKKKLGIKEEQFEERVPLKHNINKDKK